MTIGLIIAAVFLFGGRIALEGLAEKYQFLGQWLTVVTIALIVVSVVLAISLITYIAEQIAKWRNIIPQKSESQQGQIQAITRKKSRERENTRFEKKERRAVRTAWRQAEREKIQRVEAYEKRWKREKRGKHEE